MNEEEMKDKIKELEKKNELLLRLLEDYFYNKKGLPKVLKALRDGYYQDVKDYLLL